MIPPYFTDEQVSRLERNPEYRNRGSSCPVCLGEKSYMYLGVEHECPDDDYGHPMMRLAKLYWLHNIPLQYQMLLWDEFPHTDEREDIEQYLANFKRLRMVGSGITIHGEKLGVGKTWAATHVLRETVKQGYDGWFVEFFAMKNYFGMEDKAARTYLQSRLHDAEILVIDDVQRAWGSENQRALFEEKTEEVVRARTNANFPTIITTNMTEKEFSADYPRVHSLLLAKNLSFHFQGKDARKHGVVWQNNQKLALDGEARPIT